MTVYIIAEEDDLADAQEVKRRLTDKGHATFLPPSWALKDMALAMLKCEAYYVVSTQSHHRHAHCLEHLARLTGMTPIF